MDGPHSRISNERSSNSD